MEVVVGRARDEDVPSPCHCFSGGTAVQYTTVDVVTTTTSAHTFM